MFNCEEILARLAFYLDDELRDGEQVAVEAHLESCVSCRQALTQQRRLVQLVRDSRPLYLASPELRASVEKILQDSPAPYATPADLRRRIQKSLWQKGASKWSAQRLVVAAVLFAFMALGLVWTTRSLFDRKKFKSPSDFALMAVKTHMRHQSGNLPLEITTGSPEAISQWFAGKVTFGLTLPNYQELSGQNKLYNLEGARLVSFHNDYAAYVAYEMNQRPISLVVTSFDVAQPAGGEEISSHGLTFHYDTVDGLKVITWADRGLTYALVSDLAERGQQSCMVCHIGTKDKNFLEDLKMKSPQE
ncbi:MAG: zf-HC2 domain-containing protein [Acidobacteria bacterium]|nr:zf-HC2 domain-containing protein [Acidobacteriota bacterium]